MKTASAILTILIAAFAATGCGDGEPKAYGEAVTVAEKTAISDILADPEAYHDKVVRLEGAVGEVCQSMGCWFYVNDGTAQILIDLEMRPDSYAVPKNSRGKNAVVQGRIQYDGSAPVRLMGLGNTLQ